MSILLAALCFFSILTLWVPAFWPVTVFEVGIFALAIVTVLRSLKQPPFFSWPLAPLAFAVAWGLLQLAAGTTAYRYETWNATISWTAFLSVVFVAGSIFRDPQARSWFRSAMFWFAFAVAVEATLQSFTSGGKVFWLFPANHSDYLMGPILSRNHYAAFIEAVLPFGLYRALKSDRASWMYSVLTAAMFASVVASASRAGTLIAAAEILIVTVLAWRRGGSGGKLQFWPIVQVAALAGAFVLVVGPQNVWQRFWGPDPYAIRREFAISSLRMAADHPFLGSGLGTWATTYPRYALIDVGAFANQAHSDWLQWAAEGGVPLLLAMLFLFIWSVRAAFRSVWGFGVVAVLIHAAVDYPFSRPALGSWPLLIVAMMAAEGADRSGDLQ